MHLYRSQNYALLHRARVTCQTRLRQFAQPSSKDSRSGSRNQSRQAQTELKQNMPVEVPKSVLKHVREYKLPTIFSREAGMPPYPISKNISHVPTPRQGTYATSNPTQGNTYRAPQCSREPPVVKELLRQKRELQRKVMASLRK